MYCSPGHGGSLHPGATHAANGEAYTLSHSPASLSGCSTTLHLSDVREQREGAVN